MRRHACHVRRARCVRHAWQPGWMPGYRGILPSQLARSSNTSACVPCAVPTPSPALTQLRAAAHGTERVQQHMQHVLPIDEAAGAPTRSPLTGGPDLEHNVLAKGVAGGANSSSRCLVLLILRQRRRGETVGHEPDAEMCRLRPDPVRHALQGGRQAPAAHVGSGHAGGREPSSHVRGRA